MSGGIDWIRAYSMETLMGYADADAFFNLNENAAAQDYATLQQPVFINSVCDIIGNDAHLTRINGWKGFLKNDTWEIAGNHDERVMAVLQKLHKKVIVTADVPGFISASVIAMIINEAYYAKEDDVSTEAEIDVAMKLGTNYPFGPFEWAERIGLRNVYLLLQTLSKSKPKYAPGLLLTRLANL